MSETPIVRPTIRLRLTLLYGALFVVTSAVLIATAYLFVANRTFGRGDFERGNGQVREALAEAGFPSPDGSPDGGGPFEAGDNRPERPELPASVEVALDEVADNARQEVLNDLLAQSLVAFAFTASASLVLAWWVAGRALRPVDDISDAANRLSEENLHERLPNTGPDDELHRLRASFNAMLGRLEQGFEARRRFAADASHELRTPLAVLRARADNALESAADLDGADAESTRQLATDVLTEVDRAARLVEALLILARTDEASSTELVEIDLADVVGDVAGQLAVEADQLDLDLDLALADGPVRGDAGLLGLLATNIIRNAIVHNQPGGWLRVEVTSDPGAVVLSVSNSGEVVEESDLEGLFERFHRGRTADERHGHGLGLPIVDAVAQTHGADLTARSRPEGGLEVDVVFPPVQSS